MAEGKSFFNKIGNFFARIGRAIGRFGVKIGHVFSKLHHCRLFTLVRMQLHDKVDLSWTKSIKKVIQQIIFAIVKFGLVFGITYLVFLITIRLGIFYKSECIRVSTIVVAIIFLLSCLSCTIELMNTLYFDEDNKVLVTLPVDGGKLFFSKLIVYYIDELKKACFFTVPLLYACFFVAEESISDVCYIWMIIPLLFYVAIPVLIGALLSIPALFIKRLFLRAPWLELICIIALIVGVVYGIVTVIQLIPNNINIISEFGRIKITIHDTMLFFETKVYLIAQFVYMISGDCTLPAYVYVLSIKVLYRFLAMLGIFIVLVGLAFLIAKPFFFYMMTKNFEYKKKVFKEEKKNRKHSVFTTFFFKELKIQVRDFKTYITQIVTYIGIPILILLLNRIYAAMEVNLFGQLYSYLFNILLICLPLFASSTRVASIYSLEGRAAYIKKTKPVKLYWGLACKLFFYLLFSIPSIAVCAFIMYRYTDIGGFNCTYLCLGILGFQFCLVFFNAILDLINPQNEHFATVGNTNGSKNETKATIVAFIAAAAVAGLSFFLLQESNNLYGSYTHACVEIMIIGLLCFAISVYMFYSNIKCFYYEK